MEHLLLLIRVEMVKTANRLQMNPYQTLWRRQTTILMVILIIRDAAPSFTQAAHAMADSKLARARDHVSAPMLVWPPHWNALISTRKMHLQTM